MSSADRVHIFEVGPRDGLQNESRVVSTRRKIAFIEGLISSGIRDLELGAFVRPDRVPQMADTDEIYRRIQAGEIDLGRATPWCLVPNLRGLERALKVGVTRIAVFTAATETFTRKNIGMTIRESLTEFRSVIDQGRRIHGDRFKVRAYVSTAFGCPFEGKVPAKKALRVIEKLAALGVDQISIGDTIGVATPADVNQLVPHALKLLGVKKTALHFHDTRGTALANMLRSYEIGARNFDSSAGGLGGCPFAPGASGNLATEDLVYMLNGMRIPHGIDLGKLVRVSLTLFSRIGRPLSSRYLQSIASKCRIRPIS